MAYVATREARHPLVRHKIAQRYLAAELASVTLGVD